MLSTFLPSNSLSVSVSRWHGEQQVQHPAGGLGLIPDPASVLIIRAWGRLGDPI